MVLTYDVDRRTHWPIHSEHLDRLDRANFWANETQRFHLVLSNAGAVIPAGSRLDWELRDGAGERVARASAEYLRVQQALEELNPA